MKTIVNNSVLAFLFIFISCSASTDVRYGKEQKKTEEQVIVDDKIKPVEEDFDFSPYKTEFDIPEQQIKIPVTSSTGIFDIWYNYDDESETVNKKVVDKKSGYRILLFTTDNMEEANDMRSQIYSKISQMEVYLIFDPPFYKIMVGDFLELSDARDYHFRLHQMGFAEARVVNETVNVFEK